MRKKTITVIKGKKGQHLNQREANIIAEGAVDGLLLFNADVNGYKTSLMYNTEGLIPFSDFLRLNGMNRRLFVVILRNIVLILKGIEHNRFSKDLLMWDSQTVYIDPASWHVFMMYVPLQPFETTGSLKSFLLDTISQCNFEPGEDIEYVQVLVQDLNSVTAYTVGMLESYCDKESEKLLQHDENDNRSGLCPMCGFKLLATDETCPFCGKRILSRGVNMSKKEESASNQELWSAAEQHAVKLFPSLCETETEEVVTSNKSISVSEDENGVVTVFRGAQKIVQSVWLENCSQAGKIFVTKFPFRIGKMEGVTDYRICNNRISRKHADIIKEQGNYFILDLGSTNGTFLNGKRLQPGVKEKLSDGSILILADLKFKVHID